MTLQKITLDKNIRQEMTKIKTKYFIFRILIYLKYNCLKP